MRSLNWILIIGIIFCIWFWSEAVAGIIWWVSKAPVDITTLRW